MLPSSIKSHDLADARQGEPKVYANLPHLFMSKLFSKLRCLTSVLLAFFLAGNFLSVYPGPAQAAVGTIQGSFTVNQNGSSTYSIPLEAPPGTGAVQPQLSLVYNSQGRNGLLGVGWNLTGLSSIFRCPRTIAQDGASGGINYDDSDRFCVDGQRLIATYDAAGRKLTTYAERAAAYGQSGTMYSTERNTWTKFVSSGACGQGPCSFTALSKNGSALEFGVTDNSRIEAQGKTSVRVWAINKSSDRNSNYVAVSYNESSTDGEYYIDAIHFTGNTLENFSSTRRIAFDYEGREDATLSYAAGSVVKMTQRLESFSTYVQDSAGTEVLVKRYALKYEYGSSTGRSRITHIEDCAPDGQCLISRFDWTDIANGTFTGTNNSLPNYELINLGNQIKGDFNGDGLTDIGAIGSAYDTVPIAFSNGDGTFHGSNNSLPHHALISNGTLLTGDFNGDGLTDIAAIGKTYDTVPIAFSNGDGTFHGSNNSLPNFSLISNGNVFTGDFNGDGLTDIAAIGSIYDTIPIAFSNGDGTFTGTNQTLPNHSLLSRGKLKFGDFNGDGLSDIAAISSDYTTLPIAFSKGDGTFAGTNQSLPHHDLITRGEILSGDFNGDGLTDIAAIGSSYTTIPMAFSKGDGTFSAANSELPLHNLLSGSKVHLMAGNFNGDHRTDIAGFAEDYKTIPIVFSKGDGSFAGANNNLPQHELLSNRNVKLINADLNGDGLIDIAGFSKFYDTIPIAFSVNAGSSQAVDALPDLISGITNGFGGQIDIAYNSIIKSSVYARGTGAKYPQVDVQNSFYVVSRHTEKDGRGNEYRFAHHYAGAKIDLHGRGWLGFHETTVVNEQKDTQRATTYDQNFPLTTNIIGQKETTGTDAGILLGVTQNTYESVEDNGVYTVYVTDEKQDHYTYGRYNYSLQKKFAYDDAHMNIIGISDLADSSETTDDVYTCYQYPETADGADWWKSSFPSAKKILNAAVDCSQVDFEKWRASTDLSFHRYGYDSRMNLNDRNIWDDHKNKMINTKSDYDAYGNIVNYTDPLGNSSTVTYDPTHTFPIRYQTPPAENGQDPLVTEFEFEPKFGIEIKRVDVNGNVVMTIPPDGIDGWGRVLQENGIPPDSLTLEPVRMRAYLASPDEVGMRIKVWDREEWGPGGDWDENNKDKWPWKDTQVDGMGRAYLLDAKGPDAQTTLRNETIFDAAGRPWKKSLPYFHHVNGSPADDPKYTVYKYDVQDQPIEVTTPDGAVQKIIYDHLDDRKITWELPSPANDIQQNATILRHTVSDSRGRLISMEEPDGGTTFYEYDLLGWMKQKTDPMGEITQYAYNSLGQILSKINPEIGAITYGYYDTGWLKTKINAEQQELEFTYDTLGRLKKKQVLNSDETLERTVNYTYDQGANGKGRLYRIQMPEADYTYGYDYVGETKNKVTAMDVGMGTGKMDFSASFTFDALGRMKTIGYPDTSITRYTYHPDGHLATIQLKGPGQEAFEEIASYTEFTALGEYSNSTYKNGVVSSFTFDVLGRTKTSAVQKGALVLRNFEYTWNQANKLLKIADLRSQPNPSLTQDFKFTDMGRVHNATGTFGALTYAYNLTGDLTRHNNTAYVYDPLKKHQIIRGCSGPDPGQCDDSQTTLNVQHGGNGNLIRKTLLPGSGASVQWDYAYDAQNRLMKVEKEPAGGNKETVNTFTYDDSGRRLTKNEPGGTTTYYIFPFYEVTDGSDGAAYTLYIQGPKGAIFAKTKTGTRLALWQDYQNASVIAANIGIDSLGNLVSYIGAKVAQMISHPKSGAWLAVFFFASFSVLVFMAWFLSFLQTGPANSWRGRGRYKIGSFLMRRGSISPATAQAWISPDQTPGRSYWKKWRIFLPIVLMCFVLTYLSPAMAIAALTGDGNPIPGNTLYFHDDHLGSNTLVTDPSGAEKNRIVYEPYGTIDFASSSGPNDFRPKFTGKELDTKSDLYYFGARYYDSHLGRFMSPDPADEQASPYVYGADDPLTIIDPTGNEPISTVAFIVAMIVGAVIGAYVGGAVANQSANLFTWDWGSGKTWVGLITGGALGVAAVATGGAIAGAAAVAGVSAGAIAFTSVDVAFITYDSYQFAEDPSVENGIFLALDIVPVAGALIGKGIKAASRGMRGGSETAELSVRSEEGLAREGKSAAKEEDLGSFCSSFPAETQVDAAKGSKNIEDIAVGDEVWAFDEKTGQKGLRPVSRLLNRTAAAVIAVTLLAGTVEATPEHPFFVKGRGWVEAQHLKVGDEIVQRENETVPVRAVEMRKGDVRVFNFAVQEARTYYVAKEGTLVHNPKRKRCSADDDDEWLPPTKKRNTGRASFRKSTKNRVWNSATDDPKIPGNKLCATCPTSLDRTKRFPYGSHGKSRVAYDIDHTGAKWADRNAVFKRAKVSRATIIDEYQRELRLQCRTCNGSHNFEPTKTERRNYLKAMRKRYGIS